MRFETVPNNFNPAHSRYPQAWKSRVAAYLASSQSGGTRLLDRTGNGNDGTLVNFTLSSAWNLSASNGLTFASASSTKVTIPTAAFSLTGAYTIAMWVNPAASQSNQYPSFFMDGSWRLSFGLNNTGNANKLENWINNSVQNMGTAVIATSTWTHVAIVGNPTANTIVFYINGTVDKSFAYTAMTSHASNNLGGSPATTFYNGGMNDVVIATRPYLQQEIILLAQSYTPKLKTVISPVISTSLNRSFPYFYRGANA